MTCLTAEKARPGEAKMPARSAQSLPVTRHFTAWGTYIADTWTEVMRTCESSLYRPIEPGTSNSVPV